MCKLVDGYLIIGIAAAQLAQKTVGSDFEVIIRNGKLIAGGHEQGTNGVEPSDVDWEELRRKVSAPPTL